MILLERIIKSFVVVVFKYKNSIKITFKFIRLIQ